MKVAHDDVVKREVGAPCNRKHGGSVGKIQRAFSCCSAAGNVGVSLHRYGAEREVGDADQGPT